MKPQLVLLIILFNSAEMRFRKDLGMDSTFPPEIMPPTPGSVIPVGHLRPLGWQRRPDGPVDEIIDFTSPREFYNEYVSKSKPVVFRNAMLGVPAMEKWSKDDNLKKLYGDILVHVTVKKERAKTINHQVVTFKRFLKEYQYEDWYLSNIVPQAMMSDLTLPKTLRCGFTKYLLESELWMSSGGTSSLIHSHADHNLHCLLAGRKDFTVIQEKYKSMLNYVEKEHHEGAGYSTLDVDMINMFKNKEVRQVPWKWTTLKAGDCIYIPAKYIHQVRSWGRSISSTMLFSPAPVVTFSDCNRVDLQDQVLLSDAPFMWIYINGDKQLSNSKLNAASLRHHLTIIMRERGHLKKTIFADFFKNVMSQSYKSVDVDEVWKIISPDDDDMITRSKFEEVSDDALMKIAEILNVVNFPKDEL